MRADELQRELAVTRAARQIFACLALLLPVACSVNLAKESDGEVSSNQCNTDADCGTGACSSGLCVAHQGALSTLLLEITPPTTAPGVGGVRFLQLKEDSARSNQDYEIDSSPVSTVHGFVSTTKACSPGAGSTLPVAVTLTPEEQSYGLPTVSYVAQTELTAVSTACQKLLNSDGTVRFAPDVGQISRSSSSAFPSVATTST